MGKSYPKNLSLILPELNPPLITHQEGDPTTHKTPSFLMAFQKPIPNTSLVSLEHHPSSYPYFPLITRFQRTPFSIEKCQFYLLRKALLSVERHFMPKLSFLLSRQTESPALDVVSTQEAHFPKESLFKSTPISI